jgi:hypothetical protein
MAWYLAKNRNNFIFTLPDKELTLHPNWDLLQIRMEFQWENKCSHSATLSTTHPACTALELNSAFRDKLAPNAT